MVSHQHCCDSRTVLHIIRKRVGIIRDRHNVVLSPVPTVYIGVVPTAGNLYFGAFLLHPFICEFTDPSPWKQIAA